MRKSWQSASPLIWLLAACAMLWVGLWLFYDVVLQLDYPIGDAQKYYWQGSNHLQHVFEDPELLYYSHHRDHVPGYAILITAARAVLGNSPQIMRVLTFSAWIANLVVIYYLLAYWAMPVSVRLWGTLAYGLFPLTGMSTTVHPTADVFALLGLTAAVYAYLRGYLRLMVVCLIVSLFMHKFAWPVVALMLVIGLWQRRIQWWHAVLVIAPLAVYWVAISMYFDNPAYLIGGNINVGVEGGRVYPVFDGLLVSLKLGLEGSWPELLKGIAVALLFVLSVWLLVVRVWKNNLILLALILPPLLFVVVSSETVMFGVVRFGRLLIIPLWVYLFHWLSKTRGRTSLNPYLMSLIMAFGLFSQFLFIYYLL